MTASDMSKSQEELTISYFPFLVGIGWIYIIRAKVSEPAIGTFEDEIRIRMGRCYLPMPLKHYSEVI
jgi:hypothetical protein